MRLHLCLCLSLHFRCGCGCGCGCVSNRVSSFTYLPTVTLCTRVLEFVVSRFPYFFSSCSSIVQVVEELEVVLEEDAAVVVKGIWTILLKV